MTNRRRFTLFMLALFMLFLPAVAKADYAGEVKIVASDGGIADLFGCSVSISGDTAIAGACQDDDNGSSSGSAYVYVRSALGVWTVQQKLTASDGTISDDFGRFVSISGDTAIVGASLDDDSNFNAGSAYIFVRDAFGVWTEQQKLTASDAGNLDYFGFSVSVSGDTAVVGAYGDDDNGSESGSVYVFVRDIVGVWTVQQKLTASDATFSNEFGISVAIDGDTLIAGAHGAEGGAANSGAAYISVRDIAGVWTEEQKLTASDGANGDGFGVSASISVDRVVVGASLDDDLGLNSGSVYLFERDALAVWAEKKKVTASDGVAGDELGRSVSISGDRAIAGAYGDDDLGLNSGSAYILVRDGVGVWAEQQKLKASDATAGDNFGWSVFVSGSLAAAGAPGADGHNGVAMAGAVYPFKEAVLNNPPGKPTLVSPANGALGQPLAVTLTWKSVTDIDFDPVTYDIYICSTSDPVSVSSAKQRKKTIKTEMN